MLTFGTALEMYMNPYDLSIGVGREREGEKYALSICRGRGHNYKPLFTSKPWKESLEEILSIVELLLTGARNFCVEQSNMDETEDYLNANLIQVIMGRLREHQSIDTISLMPVEFA